MLAVPGSISGGSVEQVRIWPTNRLEWSLGPAVALSTQRWEASKVNEAEADTWLVTALTLSQHIVSSRTVGSTRYMRKFSYVWVVLGIGPSALSTQVNFWLLSYTPSQQKETLPQSCHYSVLPEHWEYFNWKNRGS
jgi:hypothetical protein